LSDRVKIELTKLTYKVDGNRWLSFAASGAKVAQLAQYQIPSTTKVIDADDNQLRRNLYIHHCYFPNTSALMFPLSFQHDAQRGYQHADNSCDLNSSRGCLVGRGWQFLVSHQHSARRRTNANVPIVLQVKNTAEKTATVVTR
jgi:hypothetical protein